MNEACYQVCISPDCGRTFDLSEVHFACPRCGSLLDVRYEWDKVELPASLEAFDARRGAIGSSPESRANASGVWRFRELLPFARTDELVTVGEGKTTLQDACGLASELGMKRGSLFLQYEGFNPSGSFKDNGMAAAFTAARKLGKTRVACASTGNTSASLALFARSAMTKSGAPMQAIVLVGGGKIAMGKLAQALDYGATTVQVRGDFDACMKLVRESAEKLDLYLMNSVNPFRLEGQKTIMFRILEGLAWEVPDWIVVPGGNLGNTSAFGKAFYELKELGLIDHAPRIAVINAAGANTFCELVNDHGLRYDSGRFDTTRLDTYYAQMDADGRAAKTVASAIEIARPVNLAKALRTIDCLKGVVREVPDEAILDGKALVGRFGFGCEPASGASIAGLRLLLEEGVIGKSDRVACVLTGHALKDPDVTIRYHSEQSSAATFANPPQPIEPTIDALRDAIS